MGGKQSKGGRWVKLDKKLEKESNSTIGDAQLTTLKLDWAAVKGENVDSVNWKKTSINLAEFKQLVDERCSQRFVTIPNPPDLLKNSPTCSTYMM